MQCWGPSENGAQTHGCLFRNTHKNAHLSSLEKAQFHSTFSKITGGRGGGKRVGFIWSVLQAGKTLAGHNYRTMPPGSAEKGSQGCLDTPSEWDPYCINEHTVLANELAHALSGCCPMPLYLHGGHQVEALPHDTRGTFPASRSASEKTARFPQGFLVKSNDAVLLSTSKENCALWGHPFAHCCSHWCYFPGAKTPPPSFSAVGGGNALLRTTAPMHSRNLK